MNLLRTAFLAACIAGSLLPLLPAMAAPARVDLARTAQVRSVITRATERALALRQDGAYWNLPSYLGTQFVSQYFLISAWLQQPSAELKPEVLRARLLAEQRADGSWDAVRDANLETGDLNATILDYWALKAMGEDVFSVPMARAREVILKRGGLESASRFTQILLALFGNWDWNEMPSVPYALFSDVSPVNTTQFGQWIAPHLMPIAYFKKMRLARALGDRFELPELWSNPAGWRRLRAAAPEREFPGRFSTDRLLVDKLLEGQRPAGSFGGYTVATLFSLIALDDFARSVPSYESAALVARDRGLRYVNRMYFESQYRDHDSNYRGVTDDGRYWDTALLGNALAEAIAVAGAGANEAGGADPLSATGDYLASVQTEGGGFPFGLDFEYAPDTDDTAEIALFFSRAAKLRSRGGAAHAEVIPRALGWLSGMQNDDGGWGAFARNNTGNVILRQAAKGFEDSADLFDESSPDVTGHILEAYGEAYGSSGATAAHLAEVRGAIRYLKSSQEEMGAWQGRWGVNYLYGTGAAIVGLVRVGEDVQAPYLQKAVFWLLGHQNADGGFGEGTRSYEDAAWAGRGVSTPSQTAWALLALIETGLGHSPSAERAVDYLLREFEREGKWVDSSTVGTGHPRVVYLNYPSYPYAFPLQALARYLSR